MNKEEILKLFQFVNCGSGNCLRYSNYDYISGIVDNIVILHKLKNAELEAKVYTYEKIISNSNFKSVLTKDKESMQKKIKELEQEVEILKGENNEN